MAGNNRLISHYTHTKTSWKRKSSYWHVLCHSRLSSYLESKPIIKNCMITARRSDGMMISNECPHTKVMLKMLKCVFTIFKTCVVIIRKINITFELESYNYTHKTIWSVPYLRASYLVGEAESIDNFFKKYKTNIEI